MSEKSGFFNAVLSNGSYDRTYQAEDFANCLNMVIPNGIYVTDDELDAGTPNKGSVAGLKPYASGNKLYITQGKAFINGYWYVLDETDLQVDVSVNTARAIILLYTATDRKISVVLKPLVSGLPVAPKTDTEYGIVLGDFSYSSSGLRVYDDREDFMIASPKSMQNLLNDANSALSELKSNMRNLLKASDIVKYSAKRYNGFTLDTSTKTATATISNFFGSQGKNDFVVRCTYYDDNLRRSLPVFLETEKELQSDLDKYAFYYQIDKDDTANHNVTVKITINQKLYEDLKASVSTRILRIAGYYYNFG